ncbi:hypothetical protein EUGRSUZ_G00435 [Eucalyptus grandis]|uniref:Uncharacterized protein n=2 Tax=Eucalyptus grandis TaxID=71139 RepID=A0ACC3K0A4_EUCGR|nr:hypothetical protein EUGRSUZ_G00435 [Eucalyptus grandis]
MLGQGQAGGAAGGGRGPAHPPAPSKEEREREAGGGIFGRDHRVRPRERETKREIGRGSETHRASEAKSERLPPVAIAPGARTKTLADAYLSPRSILLPLSKEGFPWFPVASLLQDRLM